MRQTCAGSVLRRGNVKYAVLLGMLLIVGAPLTAASALDLRDAKQRGLVGETPSGYLGSVRQPPSPEIQALTKDINKKRREEYQRIARENGTAVAAVEKLAAKKAIEKTPKGQYVQTENGEWAMK